MKRRSRGRTACLLLIIILFYINMDFLQVVADNRSQEWYRDYTIQVAENAGFILMANEDGTIAVLDKENQVIHESNPMEDEIATGLNLTNLQSQIYLTWVDASGNEVTKNSQAACVNKGGLSYALTEDEGIRFDYEFQAAGITIPVQYSLSDEGLIASILGSEIKENTEETGCYIVNIDLLPFFGAAGIKESGYSLVPDGSGALIYHNNKKASYGAYSQKVYGRDTALITEQLGMETECVRMPVFGMKRNDAGYLAIITSGDTNATINAMTSGTLNSYNNVYASFCYRPFTKTTFLQGNAYAGNGAGGDSTVTLTISPVKPKIDTYTVEYRFLYEYELDYVDMAETYRNYLIDTYNMESVTTQNIPLYLDILGGLKMEKYVLGVETEVLQPLTTFEQAMEILDELQQQGVRNIALKYKGWNKGGLESDIPAEISFEKKLGGERGYQELLHYVEQNQVALFMDFDFVNLYESGNGIYNFIDAAQTVGSTPSYQYTYDYNLLTKNAEECWKILTPQKVKESVGKMLGKYATLQNANIALSTMGKYIYSDFTHKSTGMDRADVRAMWEESFRLCKEASQEIMTEGGNAYAIPYVSHIYNAPTASSNYDIEDEEIPFYQICLHGLVSYSTEPLNLSEDARNLVLRAVETGSSLSACLMYQENDVLRDTKYNTILSGNQETWIDTLAEYYKETCEILDQTMTAKIIGHEKLQENVYRTIYENGITVYVNYADKEVNWNGMVIPSKDFVYERGAR